MRWASAPRRAWVRPRSEDDHAGQPRRHPVGSRWRSPPFAVFDERVAEAFCIGALPPATRALGVHSRSSSRMPEITVPGGLKTLPEGRFLDTGPAFRQRPFPEIGREFGMALPAQRALAPIS